MASRTMLPEVIPPLLPIDWRTESVLPNVIFIRSSHPHQAIGDALVPLLESSPLWIEHIAQVTVHALSNGSALVTGLLAAAKHCLASAEPCVIALVRGGGSGDDMERLATTLCSGEVRPVLEGVAPRLVFASGHARDAVRFDWLRPQCLAFGEVPLEAVRQFLNRLTADGVLKRAHQASRATAGMSNTLPSPAELPRARALRERERFALRIAQRYAQRLSAASVIDDRLLIELIHRGGVLMDFIRVVGHDYRAAVFNDNYELFVSDSYYPLSDWERILENAGVERWEIEEALAKVGLESDEDDKT